MSLSLLQAFPHLGFSPKSMTPTMFFILTSFFFFIPTNTHLQSNEQSLISVLISQKGLNFAKDILIKQAILSLTPLRLPKIQKSVKIPLVGNVHMALSNIIINQIDVSSSYIKPGNTGIVIVASGSTANLSMNWSYSYHTWLLPIEISNNGRASVKVEGMEVGLTLHLKNREGTLELSQMECHCYVKDISITLDGGASWFYQGLVGTFEGQIRSSVENTIMKKLREGILKLDSLLQTLPKEIPMDDVAALNVTFVNEPLVTDSSIEFGINGLFTAEDKVVVPNHCHENSHPSVSCQKMLKISLYETVFNSGSAIIFNAGLMQWTVDKVPKQSLLNTASWKFIVPKLYKKYPNDDMKLNISVSSPPIIRISTHKIDATIYSDVTINVLDAGETIPVACISLVTKASGSVKIRGNNLAGKIKLDSFTMSLKWSEIGNIHLHLIQLMTRTFLKTVAFPFASLRLRKGFPLPILQSFTLKNANILCTNSRIIICGDVAFTDVFDVKQPSIL